MDQFVVTGGRQLSGRVEIGGAKNAAVAIIPAAILVEGTCRIENVPSISDVTLVIDMLRQIGASVRLINSHTVEVDCSRIKNSSPPYDMARSMRASYYLIGAMLGRFNCARVSMPGGCDFGVRPIDQHIKGFEALGAKVALEHGVIEAAAPDGLRGASVYLDVVSVGATINIILAAVRAPGLTVIENAAKEPHIVDLANFLNSMGADVKGAGTDVIKIRGVERLHGGSYSIIPDQIEAGTYMVMAAATGGDVLINNVIPKHLDSLSAKLMEMGVVVEDLEDAVRIRREKRLTRCNIKTLPYPGFPTDMHPQMAVLLALAEGTSIINESVWDNRFRYVDELKRMGANIIVDGKVAVVEGVAELSAAPVKACDLRAGAAMITAALVARGTTCIEDIRHIERGYEDIVQKLRALGADIKKVSVPDKPAFEQAN